MNLLGSFFSVYNPEKQIGQFLLGQIYVLMRWHVVTTLIQNRTHVVLLTLLVSFILSIYI